MDRKVEMYHKLLLTNIVDQFPIKLLLRDAITQLQRLNQVCAKVYQPIDCFSGEFECVTRIYQYSYTEVLHCSILIIKLGHNMEFPL